MGFARQSFVGRLDSMGDAAEQAFEAWATAQGYPFVEWGFRRPPFKRFRYLNERVRFTPDYIIEYPKHYCYVECKGTGGRVLKVKPSTMRNLALHHEDIPVEFFLNDSTNDRIAIVPWDQMVEAVANSQPKAFNDGIPYHEIVLADTDFLFIDKG